MPRKPLVKTSFFPYHITNRSNNKDFFPVPAAVLWEIFITCFEYLKLEMNIELHEFVLMNNHYHLLLSTPDENLSEAMTYLQREVAKRANRRAGRENHFFGTRYKWSLITDDRYYAYAEKYILRNPVDANICDKVEEYNFSSLNTPVAENFWKPLFRTSKRLDHGYLSWLNQPYKANDRVLIKNALRRRKFQLRKDKPLFEKTTWYQRV